jgi:hypothetical protein
MQPPMSGRMRGAVARRQSSSPAAMVSRMLGVPSSSSLSLRSPAGLAMRRDRGRHTDDGWGQTRGLGAWADKGGPHLSAHGDACGSARQNKRTKGVMLPLRPF